jgi:hypothetical protein
MGTQELQSAFAQFLQSWDEEVDAILLTLEWEEITERYDFVTSRIQLFNARNVGRMKLLMEQYNAEEAAAKEASIPSIDRMKLC